jgi:lipoyl(octanoyl) transferase
MEVSHRWLGVTDYLKAKDLQHQLVAERAEDRIPDTFLYCEHPPVITLGRGFLRNPSPITAPPEVPIIETERGGLATFHGPGQLVVYPIVKIEKQSGITAKKGVVDLIRFLENWIIGTLGDFKISAGRVPEKTGVWIDSERKIASIGIGVRRWVSYHGLALNLSTGPDPWNWIQPCGFRASDMTDLQQEIGQVVTSEDFALVLQKIFLRYWKQS